MGNVDAGPVRQFSLDAQASQGDPASKVDDLSRLNRLPDRGIGGAVVAEGPGPRRVGVSAVEAGRRVNSRVPDLVQAADVVGVVVAGRNPIQVVDSQGLEQGNDDGVSLAIVAAVEKKSLPCGATQEGGVALPDIQEPDFKILGGERLRE